MIVQRTILAAATAALVLGVGIAGPASAGDNGTLKAGGINQFATIGGAAKLTQAGISTAQGINVARGKSIDVSGTITQDARVGGELTLQNYGVSSTQGVNVVLAGDPASDTITSMLPVNQALKAVEGLAALGKKSGR